MLGGGRMVILMHVRGFLHVCAVFRMQQRKLISIFAYRAIHFNEHPFNKSLVCYQVAIYKMVEVRSLAKIKMNEV